MAEISSIQQAFRVKEELVPYVGMRWTVTFVLGDRPTAYSLTPKEYSMFNKFKFSSYGDFHQYIVECRRGR